MRVGQNAHMSMNALTLYTYTMGVSGLEARIWRALTHTQRAVADQALHLELRIPRILILVRFLWHWGIRDMSMLHTGIEFHY